VLLDNMQKTTGWSLIRISNLVVTAIKN